MPRSAGLNPEQQTAVSTTEGALLVLAGAGTGKTRVVTERIAHLLKRGRARPDEIIAVTFTNKAAREMKERLARRVGRKRLEGLLVSTFHSLCVRILRRDAQALGYRPNFSITDTGEQLGLLRREMRSVAGVAKVKPEDLLAEISRAKSAGQDHRSYMRGSVEDRDVAVATAYRKYQDALRRLNAMDFDDLLLNAVALLRGEKDALRYWQDRARYCLVDEFQDTNDIQYELLKLLSARHANLCVVGDDDQSIYSWRGARPRYIVELSQRPGTTVVRLERNYRSVNSVLKAANALIAHNEDRVGKTLSSDLGEGPPVRVVAAEDPQEEAERVVAAISRRVREERIRPGAQAILLRTNAQSRACEDELRAARLPYVVLGGQSFFDHKEVRDITAYLNALANPDDDAALLRILNVPARGLGGKSVERLSAWAMERGCSVREALARAGEIPGVSVRARAGAKSLLDALETAGRVLRSDPPERLVPALIEASGYRREVESLYDEPTEQSARLASAFEVGDSYVSFLGREADGDLAGFLQEIALAGREETGEKDPLADPTTVKIITLHSAKGLEFDHVHLCGLNEGFLPHQNSIDSGDVAEERRLAYVGMTRARKSLVLSYAQSRSFRGRQVKLKPSRFLAEIPEELLDRSDRELRQEETLERIRAIRDALG